VDIALSDREGNVERLELPPGEYRMPRMSPDGTRIAFWTDDVKQAIVWIYDVSRPAARRPLTFEGNNRFPIWSADGKRVAFQSDREGDLAIFWQPADGTGNAERLTNPDKGTSHVPESWSPNGDRFLYSVMNGSDASLWTYSLKVKAGTPFGAVHSSIPTGAVFSPNGRWVAYTSNERGTTTIYVQPFPATGERHQLAPNENSSSHGVIWSPDGKELFYNPRPDGFEAVSVTTEPTFAFGNPVAVPRSFQAAAPEQRRVYDITPNGKFLGLMPAGETGSRPTQIEVVLNWFEELRARVPAQ
jgi:Tol biopolymer transport system component